MVEGCVEVMDDESSMIKDDLMGQAVGFIANVFKIYGPHFIDGWIRKNKNQRFIDLITMSDIAYCIALIENYHEVWTEEIEI